MQLPVDNRPDQCVKRIEILLFIIKFNRTDFDDLKWKTWVFSALS